MRYVVIDTFGNDEVKKLADMAAGMKMGDNLLSVNFDGVFLRAIENDDNVKIMGSDADFLRALETIEIKQYGFVMPTYVYLIYFFIRYYELTKCKKSFITLITFVPSLLKIVYKNGDIKTIVRRYADDTTNKEIIEHIYKFFNREKDTFVNYVRRMRAKLKVNVDYVLNDDLPDLL